MGYAEAGGTPAQERRERRLPLQGAVNFRDLGGYRARDGRHVRWGRIFRSDSLAELSDADVDVVAALGLRAICDLRADSERTHKPNRVLRGDPVAVNAIGFMPHRGDALLADTRLGAISAAEIELRVREIYRRFVTDQAQTYSRLLHLIEAGPLPLLVHCTSGRDRTGFASAVILMALGVPREVIAQDYALSNQYRRDLTFQIGGAVSAEVMMALTQAHPDYLAAAFAAIDQVWGSDPAYLRQGLGLSDDRRRALQEQLLEFNGGA
jgi:protein-tyrosine phosphatase